MKNIKYLSLLLAGFLFAACSSEPDLRFQQYQVSEHGAFARNLGYSGTFLLQDPAGSAITGSVEFYDDTQGSQVASYSWTVEFRANGGGNGGVDIPATTFKTYTSDQFVVAGDGLPTLAYSLGMQEALTALGLDVTDVTGGDQFRLDATVTLTDGRSFGQENTGGNLISQSPFLALVRINANVVCSSDMGGDVTFVTTGIYDGGGGSCTQGSSTTGAQTLTDLGGGVYHIDDLSWGLFLPCWGAATADGGNNSILDVCETLSYGEGVDQWGDSYSLSGLTVSGSSMTFDWVNTYGDGANTTVTRVDGADWPPLTSN